MPGADLYILKKRGLFKTTFVRTGRPRPGALPTVVERTFTSTDVEEIEYRYAALAPYLSAR